VSIISVCTDASLNFEAFSRVSRNYRKIDAIGNILCH
jgi:hypothetical protein